MYLCIYVSMYPCIHVSMHACRQAGRHAGMHECHTMPCHAMLCHAMPCHAMSCHVMSCHVLPCGLLTVQRAATARSVSDDWGSTANPRTVQLGKRTTRGPHREPENPRTGGFVPALSMHRVFSETPNACTAALICFGRGRSNFHAAGGFGEFT